MSNVFREKESGFCFVSCRSSLCSDGSLHQCGGLRDRHQGLCSDRSLHQCGDFRDRHQWLCSDRSLHQRGNGRDRHQWCGRVEGTDMR